MHHCLVNSNYHQSSEIPALHKDTSIRIPAQVFPVPIWPQATFTIDPANQGLLFQNSSHNSSQFFFKKPWFSMFP